MTIRLLALLLSLSLAAGAALAETPAKPADAEAQVAAHLDRGASLLYQGKYDEAIAELEQALKLRPTYLKARLNLATAYFHKKDYPRSERELLRCLKLDPAYTNARFNLAITYHAAEKYDEAMAAYRKVLEEDPKRDAAWKNIGRIHERQGDLLRAAADYERSLAIDPDQSGAAELRRQAEGLRLKHATAEKEAKAGSPPASTAAAAAPAAPGAPAEPSAPIVARSEPAPSGPPPGTEPPPPGSTAPEPAQVPPPATPSPAPEPAPAPEPSPPGSPATPESAGTAVAAGSEKGIEEMQPSARRKSSPEPGAATPAAPSTPPSDPQILHSVLASLVKTVSPGATLLVSAPLGAEVYLRKADIREKDPFDEYGPFRANKRTRALLKLRADITDRKHFRGYTPMTVTLEEGHYQIAFRKPGDVQSWQADGELQVQSASISIRQEDLPSDLKIYELTVTRHDPPFLVSSLFQKSAEEATAFARSACSGTAFEVDGVELQSALVPYGLDPDRIESALGMLACAGKAIVPDDGGPLVVSLTSRGHLQVARARASSVPAGASGAGTKSP